MEELNVRIERLKPMRVASMRAFGTSPEQIAWEKIRAWAEAERLFEDREKHPVFGFNNPNPTPDATEYGYEFWIGIDKNMNPPEGIEVKDFAGGLYAVATCKLIGDPKGDVMNVWQKLWQWVQSSEYDWRKTNELEKPSDPLAAEEDIVLELYLPIQEPKDTTESDAILP
jgi:DNA gyrase inhibitor GyrI